MEKACLSLKISLKIGRRLKPNKIKLNNVKINKISTTQRKNRISFEYNEKWVAFTEVVKVRAFYCTNFLRNVDAHTVASIYNKVSARH